MTMRVEPWTTTTRTWCGWFGAALSGVSTSGAGSWESWTVREYAVVRVSMREASLCACIDWSD
eukprot:25789-Eustigmatos_ZCMA.PRE.1